MTDAYRTLRVAPSDEGLLGVVIDAPPMNLIGPELVHDLVGLARLRTTSWDAAGWLTLRATLAVFIAQGRRQAVSVGALAGDGFLNAPGGRGPEALVDGQCLPQVGGAFASVAVLEVAAADSFQGPCFFQRRAEFPRDGQRLAVMVVGLPGCGRCGQQLTDVVECFGLADSFGGVAEQPQGLLVAGGGGWKVPG